MKRTRSTSATETARNPRNALGNERGNFTPDGTWLQDAERVPGKTKTYDAVMRLVQLRRERPGMYPCDFVPYIRAAGVESAFPWASEGRKHLPASWIGDGMGSRNWLAAGAGTGAERAVKTACNRFVPNPVGLLLEVTPEIAAVIASCVRQPVPVVLGPGEPAGSPAQAIDALEAPQRELLGEHGWE